MGTAVQAHAESRLLLPDRDADDVVSRGRTLYATEKVLAESRLPTLVPMVVRNDVFIGFLRVNNVLNHFEFEHAV